jgi:ferredoxin
MFVIERDALRGLVSALKDQGYTVVGPTVRDGAIVLDQLSSSEDLPHGWTDVQSAGSYAIERRSDERVFGYVLGPHSWKRFLYPPRVRLFAAKKAGKGFEVLPQDSSPSPRYAFIGIRPCELAAVQVQDRVFLEGAYADAHYAALRSDALFIGVNCTEPGGTCFCTSMETGPRARGGYDLCLTEVCGDGKHYFLVEVGGDRGQAVLEKVQHRPAEQEEADHAAQMLEAASRAMGRTMDMRNSRELLSDNFEHPRWDDIARRCMACANCTLVCPTCFCNTVEEVTDLSGEHAERWRRWDSCFTGDFTKIAGGNIRMTTRTRYRQWMTHKLANWIDQFGTPGCVGCGRCITWCPVGIDITAEMAAIRETSLSHTIG